MQSIDTTTDTKPVITFGAVRMKRITGWETYCQQCDQGVLSRNKDAAMSHAVGHAQAAHAGSAHIREKYQ